MSKSNTPEIFIALHQFDKSRAVLKDPHVDEFQIGNSTMKVTRSDGYYLDDDGNECTLFFEGAEQHCGFGVGINYPMGIAEDDKTPDKIQGYQLQYSGTSLKTMDDPTEDEAGTLAVFDGLYDVSLKHVREIYEREEIRRDDDPDSDSLIPAVSFNSIMAVTSSKSKKKNWGNTLKKPFAHPKKPDPKNTKRKIEDKEKPLRSYFKLVSKGKGESCVPLTKFYGPGDVEHSATRYIGTSGIIGPLFKWEGVYWGQHGESPIGESMTFKLAEANYTPTSGGGGLASRRMLRKNTAPAVEQDEDGEAYNGDAIGGEEEGFARPGEVENPAAALRGAKKSVTKKKKIIKKKKKVVETESEDSD